MNDTIGLTPEQLRAVIGALYLAEHAAEYAADRAGARGDSNARHFELGRGRALRQTLKLLDSVILPPPAA